MTNENTVINSPRQLKDWIHNMAKESDLVANTLLQNYMMERLLERIAISKYKDNFILKGGFLIAAMVGVDMRSTMDMDTTIKGVAINQEELEKIVQEILEVGIPDNVEFKIMSIKAIHAAGQYEDFRIGIEATFFTIKVNLKLDITTGDIIIPKEIDYTFKLMFEDREIKVKAYNLNTILAEKIESILVRNVANTRARDFYDVYILLMTRPQDIKGEELCTAILKKAEERDTLIYITNHEKYINDIQNSTDLKALWTKYRDKYVYAKDIAFEDVLNNIKEIFQY